MHDGIVNTSLKELYLKMEYVEVSLRVSMKCVFGKTIKRTNNTVCSTILAKTDNEIYIWNVA